jgi:hypothetical protein
MLLATNISGHKMRYRRAAAPHSTIGHPSFQTTLATCSDGAPSFAL